MSFDKSLPNIREVNLFNNQHYEARGVLKDASYRDGRFLNVYRPLVASEFLPKTTILSTGKPKAQAQAVAKHPGGRLVQ